MLAALDIAPRSTGWCVGAGSDLPTVGAWAYPEPRPAEVGRLLSLFDRHLCTLLDHYQPHVLVFEAPILVHRSKYSQRNDKLEDVARTLGMTAHVEWRCHDRGIPCHSVDLRSVKKELAGFGAATKNDMVAAAEKIGLSLPRSPMRAKEDAADAFGAWLILLRHHDKQKSSRFDSALWGHRGTLI